MNPTAEPRVHGLMAEFLDAEGVLSATRSAREEGYRHMDAYTPYTVEGLAAELGMHRSRLPSVVLIGGLVGAAVGFFMQYYSMAVDYPFNSGGKPINSWPAFIPVTFELLVLVASLTAFFSMLLLNGLPRPHHPIFNEPRFARASQDRFFLCIEATDPRFDARQTADFLAGLEPHGEIMRVLAEEPPAPGAPPPEAREREEAETEVTSI
jgi:hypothetical protein